MPFAVPRIGRTMLAAAAAGGALSAFAMAPSAEAAFSIARCTGSDVAGRGATFQDNAHKAWAAAFTTRTAAATCNGGPKVTYNPALPTGSGAGRGAMGSGEQSGLALGLRDNSVRFAGSDEGPVATTQQDMNTGVTGNTADDGRVHVVPVATSSVTVLVNYPTWDHDGNTATAQVACPIPGTFRQPGSSAGFNRLRVPNWKLENAFAGKYSTWGQFLADPDGSGTAHDGLDTQPEAGGAQASQYATGCTNRKLIRAVRQDNSGTTFALKDFLDSAARITPIQNEARSGAGSGEQWRTTYLNGSNQNRNWPNTSPDNDLPGAASRPAGDTSVTLRFGNDLSNAYGDIADAGNVCEAEYVRDVSFPVCRSQTTGSGGVRSVVEKNNGAIGYADLSGAVGGSGAFKKADSANDVLYYLPMAESASLDTYVEPSVNPRGAEVGERTKGANCANVPVKNMPRGLDPTLAVGWDTTSMVFPSTTDGVVQYSACTLTYALAWDDNAPVYLNIAGNTYAEEERRARTVKDYLSFAVSDEGQAALAEADYAPLATTVAPGAPADAVSALAAARKGVDAIDWDKAGIGNQVVAPPLPPPPAGGNGQPAPQPQPVVQPPAQQAPVSTFTVGSSRKRGNDLLATFRLPGTGRLQVTATGSYTQKTKRKGKKKATSRKRTVSVGKATVSVTRAGDLSVKLPMSSTSRSALKKAKRITVKLTVVFTPTGGKPNTITRTLTLRA